MEIYGEKSVATIGSECVMFMIVLIAATWLDQCGGYVYANKMGESIYIRTCGIIIYNVVIFMCEIITMGYNL